MRMLNKVTALTDNQKRFFDLYKSGREVITLTGAAGTGKTFLALYEALDSTFSGQYREVKIVRSAVPSREIGFLKGELSDKIRPYEQPYVDLCDQLLRSGTYESLKEERIVSFALTSHQRGLTYDNTVVLVDEFENMTFHELATVFTRLGKDSRIIFCGDWRQTDLITDKYDVSGFENFMRVLNRMEEHGNIDFGIEDIVRGPLVKSFLEAMYSEV